MWSPSDYSQYMEGEAKKCKRDYGSNQSYTKVEGSAIDYKAEYESLVDENYNLKLENSKLSDALLRLAKS